MKSLANNLLYIAHAICEDLRVAYPQYKGVDLDKERLSLNCQTRGLGLFSLDLPSLDSLLTKGLEQGRLVLEGPLSRAVSKRVRVPRFFSGLWLRVFDSTGCLREAPDVNAILFLRQIFCLGKKVQSECSPARLRKAVGEYHDIERELRPPTLGWQFNEFDPDNRLQSVHLCDSLDPDLPLFPSKECRGDTERLIRILRKCQHVADIISSSLGFFEPVTYSGEMERRSRGAGFKHGPGAVSDRSGLVRKYELPRWSRKLDEWFPYRDCGTIASDKESIPLDHEVSSKLIAVPKTAKSPRLIASEPTEHQWCQQLIKKFMVERLAFLFGRDFVCFTDQSLSGRMVVDASRDRSLATIDLSSASDRLSCFVVERIFRGNPSLLHALHAARTRYLRENISSSSYQFTGLKKFASQGTATTFPVQTFVFLCIALGCSIDGRVTWTKIRKLRRSVRVFGDDIIVPADRYAAIVDTLTILGLKVNDEKSFVKGFFRESCGSDYYMGHNVTPVKPEVAIADGPASRIAMVDLSNNLFEKGFWRAAKAVESTIGRPIRALPITGLESGTFGLHSFTGMSLDHLAKRWNDRLSRWEWKVWSPSTRVPKVSPGGLPALLQFFTAAHNPEQAREHGYAGRPKTRDGLRWDPCYP